MKGPEPQWFGPFLLSGRGDTGLHVLAEVLIGRLTGASFRKWQSFESDLPAHTTTQARTARGITP
jgi:hypothetical protein